MNLANITKIQHPDDVRDALGFRGQPSGVNLKERYEQALSDNDGAYSQGDLRIAWKLASDPYYWPTFDRYKNIGTVIDAGFYDDGLKPGELNTYKDPRHITTPLEVIRGNLESLTREGKLHDKPLVVAITTGGFAPVHEGHLAMMESANYALKNKGYNVLGGFMSPDHDSYVAGKGDDARRLTADFRTRLLSMVLEEGSDWLRVDPWTSRYAPSDINFTDVVDRLRTYINSNLDSPIDIKIAYVFGGDNAQFTRAFVGSNDVAVCVARPGEVKVGELIQKSGLSEEDNILFTRSTEIDKSSRQVRSGELPAISKLAEDQNWMKWLKGEPRQPVKGDKKPAYLVRDDLSWGTEEWREKVGHETLNAALEKFRNGLTRAIENAFERSRAHGYPETVRVVHLPLENQIKIADDLMALKPDGIINNDVITGGSRNAIGISRLFDMSGAQLRGKKIIPRNGNKTLKDILGRLPKGTYDFIDDDIATGTTARLIEEELPEGIEFGDIIALSEKAFKELHPDEEYSFWDIVDARDFLLGSKNGGLVVQLFNGEVGRAPYMLPYTSLASRAQIPPDQEKAFTAEILKLNKRFFRDVWTDLHLKDADPQFKSLMNSIGFKDNMRLTDLSSWHEERMPG